jgi:hypothetical protein
MSRDAATEGYERFLASAIDATREEFSVRRALGGSTLEPGGLAIDLLRSSSGELERLLVEPELAAHRERALSQFEVVVEYAASGEPIEAFADEILALDSYLEVLREDLPERRREVIEGEIVARNRTIGEAIVPLLERPEDEFWPAMEGAFDRSDALAFVDRVFSFATPLRRRPDAFSFEARLDPDGVLRGPFASSLPAVTVEYTDEAIRAIGRAEERVVHEATTEIRERFD